MNKNLQTVYNYHNDTKHSHTAYARSLGYMDWATQPDPYRTYLGSKQKVLPLAFSHDTLPYHTIFDENTKEVAPICLQSISQFFQFSLGLAAVKVSGEQSWALRCNASSGNLQPTEAYIICEDIDGIDNGLHHYAPKLHNLELLAASNNKTALPKDSFLLAMSSIVWREAWKYGERSWRYTQLDCGHALRALEVSAYMLGWKVEKIASNEEELSSLMGLNQKSRYIEEETEHPDMLLLISKETIKEEINIKKLRNNFEELYDSGANNLSSSWHEWPLLDTIEDACKIQKINLEKVSKKDNTKRIETFESKDIVLKRRSAQVMNPKDTHITFDAFEKIIASVAGTLDGNEIAVNLALMVHDVQSLESGLYILIRDMKYKGKLQTALKDEFLWEKISTEAGDLYLLKKDDYRTLAKTISCNQDIAKDSAFSLGMLADFSDQINTHGAYKYKELYWECGAIGQQLYLESTSLELSATGIGCYLDDIFHNLLGITDMSYQSLYHFTIGRGIFDSRLSTIEPYDFRIIRS